MLKSKEMLQYNCSKGIGNLLSQGQSEPWNILKESVSLPAATLSSSVINHNQLWMEAFAKTFNFVLAPHGKTTMLPDLFKLQMESPISFGMTLATVHQVLVAFKNGIKRVIMANQLIGQCNMSIISSIMEKDPTFEFICLVDSSANIVQLGNFFSARKQNVKVLLEYGISGGRTGIRDETQEHSVLTELKNWNCICVVGVEFFEGILQEETDIRRFINWSLSRVEKLAKKNIFASDEIIITGAGTSWFDIVAKDFQKFEEDCTLRLTKVIRSGCYLIYDNGLYKTMEKRVLDMNLGEEKEELKILSKTLQPALKVWAYVQSVPEKNLAIIGMGRRDAGNDSGFPVLYLHFRPGQEAPTYFNKSTSALEIFKMMDQHSFLKISENDDIQVGDILAFDIYHPCTTMDKWRNVLLIDEAHNVLDVFVSEF